MLKEKISDIDWSYAATSLLHANPTREEVWWVGWTEVPSDTSAEDIVPHIKKTINELAKGALHGEVGSNH